MEYFDYTSLNLIERFYVEGIASELSPLREAFATNMKRALGSVLMPYDAVDKSTMLIDSFRAVNALAQSTPELSVEYEARLKSVDWKQIGVFDLIQGLFMELLPKLIKDDPKGEKIPENIKQYIEWLPENTWADRVAPYLHVFVKNVMLNSPAQKWYRGQLHQAIVSGWTAFECLAHDAWTHMLNHYPLKLVHRINTCQDKKVRAKAIRLNVLQSHGFDLSKHMGAILARKFKLNVYEGIVKAYKAVFHEHTALISVFNNDDLRLAAFSRNVIVHKAGVIDTKFVSKVQRYFPCTVGEELCFDPVRFSRTINAMTEAGLGLLKELTPIIEKLKQA